ncbi:TonB family protein [Pedobacter sp.]|jgi:TonB family protein|uniref:energy transducer TonB n=1 Tax=Pedobacter sp. TaxID=1411316 RepID=UPI002C43AE52|nr:TonB family protein [Pedobacter sp.]HWW42249.1 TonB family protein [Pedobacter sp.]
MKKLMLSLILTGLFATVNAQRQNVYFLKNNDKEVKERDSADFIRIIQEPDSGNVNFKLLEYYPEGGRKTIGFTSQIIPLVYEGAYMSFNKKGKKIGLLNYNAGWLEGPAYYFFDNGVLQKQIDYGKERVFDRILNDGRYQTTSKVVYIADSLGNVMVKAGNGHFVQKQNEKNGEMLTEEGDYKDGLKEGEWTMKSSSGNYCYKEQFEQGKLLYGESFKDGLKYSYTVGEKQPEYEGGMEKFYKYLRKEVKYPAEAADDKAMGKVFLSFTIEKDGKITGLTVDRSAHPSLDREALRVINKSSGWVPGLHHGIPVRMKYSLPISFTISGY